MRASFACAVPRWWWWLWVYFRIIFNVFSLLPSITCSFQIDKHGMGGGGKLDAMPCQNECLIKFSIRLHQITGLLVSHVSLFRKSRLCHTHKHRKNFEIRKKIIDRKQEISIAYICCYSYCCLPVFVNEKKNILFLSIFFLFIFAIVTLTSPSLALRTSVLGLVSGGIAKKDKHRLSDVTMFT